MLVDRETSKEGRRQQTGFRAGIEARRERSGSRRGRPAERA